MNNTHILYTVSRATDNPQEYKWVCDIVGVEQEVLNLPMHNLRLYLGEISRYPTLKEAVRRLYLEVARLPVFKRVETVQLLRRSAIINNTFHLVGRSADDSLIILGIIYRRPLTLGEI